MTNKLASVTSQEATFDRAPPCNLSSHKSSSNKAFASLRSAVSNPSVNQL